MQQLIAQHKITDLSGLTQLINSQGIKFDQRIENKVYHLLQAQPASKLFASYTQKILPQTLSWYTPQMVDSFAQDYNQVEQAPAEQNKAISRLQGMR